MGGYGTWRVARHTPDRWAAVAIGSCFWPGSEVNENDPLLPNFKGIPVRVYAGEHDYAGRASRFSEKLASLGVDEKLVIAPGMGHNVSEEELDGAVNWLLAHKREAPDQFTFMMNHPAFRGRNGVTIKEAVIMDQPWFECRVTGNRVELDSKNVAALSVNAAGGGLGLEGEVVILWNGHQVYAGPAAEVELK